LLFISSAVGYAIGTWCDFGLAMSDYNFTTFRIAASLQLIPQSIALGLVMWKATDSWRWLLTHEKPTEARLALAKVKDQDQDSPAMREYFDRAIQHCTLSSSSHPLFSCARTRATKQTSNSTFNKLNPRPLRRLIIAVMIQLMASIAGSVVFNNFMAITLSQIFFTSSETVDHIILAAFVPTIDIINTTIPYFLLPRLGVRKVLMIGSVGLATCMLIATAIIFGTDDNGIVDFARAESLQANQYSASTTALFCFFLLTFTFWSMSWLVSSYLLQSELPSSLSYHNENSATAAIASSARAAADCGMLYTAMDAFTNSPATPYLPIVFLLINIGIAVSVFLYVPETVGRSLEQIDAYFCRAPRKLVFLDYDARGVQRRPGSGLQQEWDMAELQASRDAAKDGDEVENVHIDVPQPIPKGSRVDRSMPQ
jgi:hypothetical protein